MTTKKTTTAAKTYEEFLNGVIIGITEVAKITGIDTRKLRYWQEKGIIEAVEGTGVGSGSAKQFSLCTLKKIILIQDLLEDGYTLDGAAKKIEQRLAKIDSLFDLINISNTEQK